MAGQKTKVEALLKGRELKALMKAGRWKVEAWENIGWHYRIVCGHLAVYTVGEGKKLEYDAMLLEEKGGVGEPLYFGGGGFCTDPNKAVKERIRVLRKFISMWQGVLDSLKEVG